LAKVATRYEKNIDKNRFFIFSPKFLYEKSIFYPPFIPFAGVRFCRKNLAGKSSTDFG